MTSWCIGFTIALIVYFSLCYILSLMKRFDFYCSEYTLSIDNRKIQDELIAKLHSLLIKDEEATAFPEKFSISYNDLIQAIIDSRLSEVISEATVAKFKQVKQTKDNSEIECLCRELIHNVR